MAMFLRQMAEVFLLRTRPASSIEKPAAIHITRTPAKRKRKELRMKAVSAERPEAAGAGPASCAKAAAAGANRSSRLTAPNARVRSIVLSFQGEVRLPGRPLRPCGCAAP